MDIPITNINGIQAENGFNGEIALIDCSVAIIKKYTFAYRLNWSSKHKGKKFQTVYLDVFMKFEANLA